MTNDRVNSNRLFEDDDRAFVPIEDNEEGEDPETEETPPEGGDEDEPATQEKGGYPKEPRTLAVVRKIRERLHSIQDDVENGEGELDKKSLADRVREAISDCDCLDCECQPDRTDAVD